MELKDFSPDQIKRMTRQPSKGQADIATPKPSKYRNVRTVVDGIVFDSKREASYWQQLKYREQAGDISDLRRQVAYPLYAPCIKEGAGFWAEVAKYIADFKFTDKDGVLHVQDVKGGKTGGTRTAMYALKRRWLSLQQGIEVEEIS